MNDKRCTFSAFFLFLFVAFPYVSFTNTPFDTQPYALLLSTIILASIIILKKDLKIPKSLTSFFILSLVAIIRATVSLDSFNTLRSLVGYISVFLVSLAGYYTFRYIKPLYLNIFIWIWFFFGITQQFFNKLIGSNLVARMSTSQDRGVTSLAVEPSAYSIICIFFLLMNDIFYAKNLLNKKQFNTNSIILIIQLLLSKSAMGFIIFTVYLIAKLLFGSSIQKKIIGLFSFLFFLITFYFLFTKVPSLINTRIGTLIIKAQIAPMNLIYLDGSIADRVSHILVSFVSIFHSYGLGYGLGTWNDYALNIARNSGNFIFNITNVHFSLGRIMSAWGNAIFELGIIGGYYPISFILLMTRGKKLVNNQMKYVYNVSMITVSLIMLMSVPLSFPFFGYILGVFMFIQTE